MMGDARDRARPGSRRPPTGAGRAAPGRRDSVEWAPMPVGRARNGGRMTDSATAHVYGALLDDAEKQLDRAVTLRRRLHAHPELGLVLPRTQAAVLEELDDLGL